MSLTHWLAERKRAEILLLCVAVLGLYLPFLGNPFFFDDLSFFDKERELPTSLDALLSARWLSYAVLALLIDLFSSTLPHVFRLLNALLHLGVVLALFAMTRRLLSLESMPAQWRVVQWVAAAAALWFGLHPAATYAAAYVVQISMLMATLFSLLALLCLLLLLESGRWRWAAMLVLMFYLASYSKEHAIALLPVLAALLVLRRGQYRSSVAQLTVCAAAMAAICLLVLLQMKGVVGKAYEPMVTHALAEGGQSLSHLLSAMTQAGLFFKYLLLWILPLPGWMSVDIRIAFPDSAAAPQAWVGTLAFLLYGLLAARMLFKRGLIAVAGFGLLWPWLMFWIEFTGVRVQEPFVIYRSYLWMPGLALALAAGILMVLPHVRTLIRSPLRLSAIGCALASVAGLLLAVASGDRLAVASDPWRLWNDAARLLPATDLPGGANRIFYNRGSASLAAGRPLEAIADFERTAAISPGLAPVHQALGLARLAAGQADGAEKAFARALALAPDNPALLYAHGVALKRLGRSKEAASEIQKGCRAGHAHACLLQAWFTDRPGIPQQAPPPRK